jgi:hypothetical protein
MNGENDHLYDTEHLDLCPVCDRPERECVCPPEDDKPDLGRDDDSAGFGTGFEQTPEQKADQEHVDRLFAAGGVSAYSAVTGPIDSNLNIVTVNPDQLTKVGDDTYVTEASDLGWKPGFWPWKLDLGRGIGNGMLFHQSFADSGSTLYRQTDGHVVVEVFND